MTDIDTSPARVDLAQENGQMPLHEPYFKLMRRNGEYKVSRGGIDYADCYSADQMRAIVAAEVAKEREECAALCDRFSARDMHPAECATAIRTA